MIKKKTTHLCKKKGRIRNRHLNLHLIQPLFLVNKRPSDEENGAYGSRTRGLNNANVARSQLR